MFGAQSLWHIQGSCVDALYLNHQKSLAALLCQSISATLHFTCLASPVTVLVAFKFEESGESGGSLIFELAADMTLSGAGGWGQVVFQVAQVAQTPPIRYPSHCPKSVDLAECWCAGAASSHG